MRDADSVLYFTDKDSFNQFINHIHPDPYSEFEKFSTHFSQTVKENGPDSFHTTISVYNSSKEFVGVVTCRNTEDKDDLYLAMSEMLYFPMSIASDLFVVANDVRIRKLDKDTNLVDADIEPQDAMTLTYVSTDHCAIFTCPYEVDSDNNLIWKESEFYLSKIALSSDEETPVGDMIELFFVYSHTDSVGPFSTEEVLNYLNSKGFVYKIFHPEKLTKKTKALGFIV